MIQGRTTTGQRIPELPLLPPAPLVPRVGEILLAPMSAGGGVPLHPIEGCRVSSSGLLLVGFHGREAGDLPL
jgi:hypothetical protein